jgi:hypothetical protein
MMTGVMHPEIIGIEEEGVGRTWPSHGKGASGGSVGSGDKATVYISAILASTSIGAVMRRPAASYRMRERSLERAGESLSPAADRRIDLRATLDFLCFTYGAELRHTSGGDGCGHGG